MQIVGIARAKCGRNGPYTWTAAAEKETERERASEAKEQVTVGRAKVKSIYG